MKQFSTVLKAAAVMAASLLLFSCSKPKVIELSVSPQAVNFDAAAGEKTVSVSCNDSWTVTASQAWVSVSQSNGENNGAVKISVSANETFSDRFADVTVKSGEKSVNVVVSQMGMNPSMGLTGSNIEAKVEGGTFEVIVTTNTEWTVATPSVDWVSVSPASGKGDGKIVVTVKPTDLYETRATEIAVESKQLPLPATIKVKQEALTYTAHQKDSLALVAVYNAADGANWKESRKWDLEKPINEWPGIKLDEEGRVIEMSITNGTVTTNEWEIPSEFADLSALQTLQIVGSKLKGDIPEFLYDITTLKVIRFNTNPKVTGGLSAKLGQLTELTELYINGNSGMSGSLPKEIGNLTKLARLNISESGIDGAIPVELGQCVGLEQFMAFKSKLTGELPDIWDLPVLQTVMVRDSQGLTGDLPASLGKLKPMVKGTTVTAPSLQLYGCNFTGNIPESFAELHENTKQVYVQGNKMSGVIPASVQAHKNFANWKIGPQQDGYGLTLE